MDEGALIFAAAMVVLFSIIMLIKNIIDKLIFFINKFKYKTNLKNDYKSRPELEKVRKFIRSMSDREFEFFCANLLSLTKGWNAEVTQAARDGGKDIIITDQDMNMGYVECKHYSKNKNVGIAIVERLIGTCRRAGETIPILMTTGKVSSAAWKCKDEVMIIDMERIMKLVSSLDNYSIDILIDSTKKKIVNYNFI